MYLITLDSPLGKLEITENDGAIARLRIGKPGDVDGTGEIDDTPLLREAKAQIKAYFEYPSSTPGSWHRRDRSI